MNPITARPASEVTAPEQPRPHRTVRSALVWAVPAVAAAVLGLLEVGSPQLWRDEFASWSAASRTLPQLWAMVHNIDAVLGLYYLGLHLWMGVFGASATSMRVPSVIAMAAAAGVVALIGRRLSGGAAGLAGGIIFALIPSVTRYGQEARPYAFATLFAALATLQFLRAMERPRYGRWVLYSVLLAAAGAANLIALCIAAAHLAIVLWDFCQRTLRFGGDASAEDGTAEAGWTLPGGRTSPEGTPVLLLFRFVLAVVLGAILVSPLALEGHTQQSWQIGSGSTPHVAELIGFSGGNWQELFSSTPVAAVTMLLAVLALFAARDTRGRIAAGYALAFAIVPVVVVWVISRGPTSYWTYRYMLFSIFGWAVGAGLCVTWIGERVRDSRLARLTGPVSPRFAAAGVLVAIVGLVGVHDQAAVRSYEAHNEWAFPELPSNGLPVDYKGAAAVIAAHERPGDGIVYQVSDDNHYQVDTSIDYYLQGKLQPKPVFQAQTQVQSNSLQPVDCVEPSACLSGAPRIWVVYVTHLAPAPFAAMAYSQAVYLQTEGYQIQTQYQEDGISVALLTVS